MDLLLKGLEERANFKKDHQAIQQVYDSQNICEVCGNINHSGYTCPQLQQDVISINNNYQSQDGINKKVSTNVIIIFLLTLVTHP